MKGSIGPHMLTAIAMVLCTGAAFAQATDRDADMRGLGDCQDCVFDGRNFADLRLMGVDLGKAILTATSFDRANLSIAVFDGADLTGVSFDGADLRGASFVDARLTDVTFADADLRGAVFDGAVLTGTDLQPARLCNTQMPDDETDNSDCQ